jgi:hypothetical protein
MQIIKTHQAFDGTILITYQDKTGYINTIPQKIFTKKFKPCQKKSNK